MTHQPQEGKASALDIEEIMVCDSTCKTCDGHGVVASVGFIDAGVMYPEADPCHSCNGSGRHPPREPRT